MSVFNVAEARRALRKLPAVFGGSAVPVQAGGGACRAILRAMQWEADAEARVKRAPFFIRPFIRSRAEKEARSRGLAQVTATLLDELKASEHKPQDPSGSV